VPPEATHFKPLKYTDFIGAHDTIRKCDFAFGGQRSAIREGMGFGHAQLQRLPPGLGNELGNRKGGPKAAACFVPSAGGLRLLAPFDISNRREPRIRARPRPSR